MKKMICPDCNGSGYILYKDEAGREIAKICNCKKLMEARKKLWDSGLAKEFQNKTFDDYRTLDKNKLKNAKQIAMNYVKNMTDGNENFSLLMCGQAGAGKTHLGTACSIELINSGRAVIYMGYQETVTELKSLVVDATSYSRALSRYKETEILFIDDFLKGRLTESDINIVYEIINHRYNNRLPVIISTEKTIKELVSFDEAISSRLIEMSGKYIIVFAGKELNYRLYHGFADEGYCAAVNSSTSLHRQS